MARPIDEALAFLDESHRKFHDTIARVPEGDRERRAHPVRWSVAEIVQHLAIVETRVAAELRGALDAARRDNVRSSQDDGAGLDPEDIARWTDRSRQLTASDRAQPAAGVSFDAAVSTYDTARSGVRDLLAGAADLPLGQIVAPHPVFGPMNVYRWVAFAGAHEARHTEQILETARQLRAPREAAVDHSARVPVSDNRAERRFELEVDGKTAFLEYDRTSDELRLIHTEVPPELRGRHLGERLVKAALDAARAERLRVLAVCPFVRTYLRRHPQEE